MSDTYFKIPINPCVASRPRVCGRRAFYTGRYKAFKENTSSYFAADVKWSREKLPTGPLDVWVSVYCTQPKKTKLRYPTGDIDNYCKAVLDCLNLVVWDDDDQIVDLHAKKRWAPPGVPGYFTVKFHDHEPDEDENRCK